MALELGPEDVNKLKIIYLKFQMSCSKILKKETLPVESFSICQLELTIFFSFCPRSPQPSISLLPCNFEAAFTGPFFLPQDLCLSIEVNFFLDIGDPVSILQISFFSLINLFVISNDFF